MPTRHLLKRLQSSCLNRRLTLFGRSLFLIICEILANVACWIATGIAFGQHEETRNTLSLALLAWTIGLRHGLDADHISAIDNATRGLINLGQLPVTCGLFFSLGHSTIVIVVNIAIAISTNVYDKISGVGDVGGIVGGAVSGSFLFIIGLANSIILYKIVRNRRRPRTGPIDVVPDEDDKQYSSIMMKILGPVTTFVNKPWKMYPVGVLFGFGFDTASSIALLAVTALAQRDADGKGIPRRDIVILPLLFTAGMTLVDSVDSILMLYAYAGVPDRAFVLYEREASFDIEHVNREPDSESAAPLSPLSQESNSSTTSEPLVKKSTNKSTNQDTIAEIAAAPELLEDSAAERRTNDMTAERTLRVKQNTMSGLSITLTLISILVAFSISIITIMGLIGENCGPCQRAANAPDGGGFSGKWWRGWARANDQSGLIGAAIVGVFVAILLVCRSFGLVMTVAMFLRSTGNEFGGNIDPVSATNNGHPHYATSSLQDKIVAYSSISLGASVFAIFLYFYIAPLVKAQRKAHLTKERLRLLKPFSNQRQLYDHDRYGASHSVDSEEFEPLVPRRIIPKDSVGIAKARQGAAPVNLHPFLPHFTPPRPGSKLVHQVASSPLNDNRPLYGDFCASSLPGSPSAAPKGLTVVRPSGSFCPISVVSCSQDSIVAVETVESSNTPSIRNQSKENAGLATISPARRICGVTPRTASLHATLHSATASKFNSAQEHCEKRSFHAHIDHGDTIRLSSPVYADTILPRYLRDSFKPSQAEQASICTEARKEYEEAYAKLPTFSIRDSVDINPAPKIQSLHIKETVLARASSITLGLVGTSPTKSKTLTGTALQFEMVEGDSKIFPENSSIK